MASITISAILKAIPGKEHAFREELRKMIDPSRAEKGCIEYILHESVEHKGIFVFYETWEDEESLSSHTETSHYKEYLKQIDTLLESREVYRLQNIER